VRLRLRHRSCGDGCQRANERGGEDGFCFHGRSIIWLIGLLTSPS
jgi:hypothetical protein